MTPSAIDTAAAHLWQAWQQGRSLDDLPADCRPRDPAEGYAVQAALVGLSGQAVAGWKIAATSSAGQSHIGVSGPLAGRLLAGHFSRHPATVTMGAGNIMRVAEAEFAFRIALNWIANNHALQGEGLRAGQVVTTGVCGKPVPNSGKPRSLPAAPVQLPFPDNLVSTEPTSSPQQLPLETG